MKSTNLFILAVSTLLAFSAEAAATTTTFPPPNAANPPPKNLQNQPPLCIYPPPPPPQSLNSPPASLPLPTPTPTPPSLTPPAKPDHAVWCVAKPTVPASTLQTALDYACASGADCRPVQVNGACYQPDTVLAHSSFAFNSYWQKNKMAGGTCDFGGSAMLVPVDPSYDQCRFLSV